MAAVTLSNNNNNNNNQAPKGEDVVTIPNGGDQELLLLSSLPKNVNGWGVGDLYNYQGFWCYSVSVKGAIALQRDFEARDTDLIIATVPRSGTNWLKSMAFAIVNRACYPIPPKHDLQQHPLRTTSSHELVPVIEYKYHGDLSHLNFTNIQSPRLLSTHLPYPSLPESIIKNNSSRIVYLCRNPKDNFISLWHFCKKLPQAKRTTTTTTIENDDHQTPSSPVLLPLEEALDLFCNGVSMFGPFWDHVLGYWKASLERPESILFLKYEDMKKDPKSHLKRLAEFLGHPFSAEEESEGMMEEILNLCNFQHMKNLDVNKYGKLSMGFENKIHFRKGEVGDWKNYLTPEMAQRIDRLTEEKLRGSGLVFQSTLD